MGGVLAKGMSRVIVRAVEPEVLGWVDSGKGWWTHRVTGQRYLPPPGIAWKLQIPPWIDDDDIKAMAETGGLC